MLKDITKIKVDPKHCDGAFYKMLVPQSKSTETISINRAEKRQLDS